MLIQVVHCHPLTDSYNHALFHTIVAALEDNGHQVAATDLYREQFDPAMSADERRSYYAARYDNTMVSAHTALLIISRVDGIIFCFPHWWFAMPAMLKGYFDRVWLPGVAFDVLPDGTVSTDRLKNIRRIIVVTTYGGSWWMVRVGLGDPARKVIGRAVRALCARTCRVTWFVHYDMDRAKPPELKRFLERVRAGVLRL